MRSRLMSILISLLWLPVCFGQRVEPVPTSCELDRLIADLRSDDKRWNATSALGRLEQMGESVLARLEAALQSDDRQQRQAAASLLIRLFSLRDSRSASTALVPTSRALLRVCVEGLRSDNLPRADVPASQQAQYPNDYSETEIFNAAAGLRFLSRHADEAEDLLIEALSSSDLQQRFLAAAALGHGRKVCVADRVAKILIPHLRSNRIQGDATIAMIALIRLGPAAEPRIEEARRTAVDDQQAKLLDVLAAEIRNPGSVARTNWRTSGRVPRDCEESVSVALTLCNFESVSISLSRDMTNEDRDRPPEALRKSEMDDGSFPPNSPPTIPR